MSLPSDTPDPSTDCRLLSFTLPRRLVWNDVQMLIHHLEHGASLIHYQSTPNLVKLVHAPLWCPGSKSGETIAFNVVTATFDKRECSSEWEVSVDLYPMQEGDPWHHWVRLKASLKKSFPCQLQECKLDTIGERVVRVYKDDDLLPKQGVTGTLQRLVLLPLLKASLNNMEGHGISFAEIQRLLGGIEWAIL